MTIHKIIEKQLSNKGFMSAKVIFTEQAEIDLKNPDKPFYERDRLLHIFNGRLRGCLENDPDNIHIPFFKNAIPELESIDQKSEIYFWNAEYKTTTLTGRSTKELLLHVYP